MGFLDGSRPAVSDIALVTNLVNLHHGDVRLDEKSHPKLYAYKSLWFERSVLQKRIAEEDQVIQQARDKAAAREFMASTAE